MCSHVSNIVTEANQSVTVSPFSSSFETQQIYEEWFSSNFDGLSQKKYIYQKTKCVGKLGIYQRLSLAKSAFKNIISDSVSIVKARPVKS